MHGVGTFEGPDGTAYQARPRDRAGLGPEPGARARG